MTEILSDHRRALAVAAGVRVVEVSLREILELGSRIAGVVDGNIRPLINSSLLASYYLAGTDDFEPERDLKDLIHFMDEGSFQLASLLKAMRDARKANVEKGN